MCGPSGRISQYDFEQLIDYDEVARMCVVRARWSSPEQRMVEDELSECVTIHVHYFKDGVEVGYWCPFTSGGFLFEKPRAWSDDFKQRLRPGRECHTTLRGPQSQA